MKKICTHILILLLTFTTSTLYCQTDADTSNKLEKVILKMHNGDEFKGVILKKDENTISLETTNGILNLNASRVKSIEVDTYSGEYNFANPHDTRYFFAPSGIPIKKNKGYYQNIMVTTNFINYGITKNISMGGGFEFISTILGNPVWFLTPKIGVDISKNIHVAGGVLLAGFGLEGSASLGYGVLTLGTSESNLSVGAGYGFIDAEISKYPAIMISGTQRLSNGLALLSENYIIPTTIESGAVYFGIHGLRIMSSKSTFDIGVIISPSFINYIPALPFVGYARAF